MKFNTLFWIIALFLVLCVTGCGLSSKPQADNLLEEVQQRQKLTIGVKYDAPPFGFLDADGSLKGMEIDLAREIAKRLLGDEKAIRFVQVNTSTRVASLQAEQVDFVLATMTITEERKKSLGFYKSLLSRCSSYYGE